MEAKGRFHENAAASGRSARTAGERIEANIDKLEGKSDKAEDALDKARAHLAKLERDYDSAWRRVGNDLIATADEDASFRWGRRSPGARGRDFTSRALAGGGSESVVRCYQPLSLAPVGQRRRIANPREPQVSQGQGVRLAGRQGFEFGAMHFCKWLMALDFRH